MHYSTTSQQKSVTFTNMIKRDVRLSSMIFSTFATIIRSFLS